MPKSASMRAIIQSRMISSQPVGILPPFRELQR
jgi:hypothetical protein